MNKAELIKIIVPATIAQWTVETPQFSHAGKEKKLSNSFRGWNKKDLESKLFFLQQKGYATI